MKRIGSLLIALSAAGACSHAALPSARADAAAEFYRNKQITLLVEAVGGGYGNNGRVLAEFMGRHIPGEPKVVMVAKPGAGGRTVMNYLYSVAPRDGTMVGFLHKDIGAFSLLEPEGVQYDSGQFRWIGSIAPMNTILYVTPKAGVGTLQEARTKEVVMAANGTSHPTAFFPRLINNFLGTKFKVVAGYRGGADVMLAVERGEAGGTTNPWDTVEARYPNWRKERQFIPLVALSLERDTTLPEVPTLGSMIANTADREVVDFLVTGSQVGRAFAAPPDVPADRLAVLRRAFDLTIKDPEFLAAMAKARLPVEGRHGAEVEALVRKSAGASPELVARARRAVGLQ